LKEYWRDASAKVSLAEGQISLIAISERLGAEKPPAETTLTVFTEASRQL
jgi:hypothetical protein